MKRSMEIEPLRVNELEANLKFLRMEPRAERRRMNRFEALRVFCVAAESLNFREAAVRLGVSPQVITRVVKQLEKELGEPLFHRSTRGVRMTHFAEQLALRSAAAIAGVENIFSAETSGATDELAGVVRIAAPSALGRRLIARGSRRFSRRILGSDWICAYRKCSQMWSTNRSTSGCGSARCATAALSRKRYRRRGCMSSLRPRCSSVSGILQARAIC